MKTVSCALLLVGFASYHLATDATRAAPRVSPPPSRVEPIAEAISQTQFFDQPLIPTREPTLEENQALITALERLGQRAVRDDFSSVTEFLYRYADSPWSLSLETQLGYEYFRVGRYSKAMAAWKRVWLTGQAQGGEIASSQANRAGSELAMMHARLGRMVELRPLLAELERRPSRGKLPHHLRGAQDGLWSMEHWPEVSFRCGTLALDRICFATDRAKAGNPLIQNSQSTTNGFSASQLAEFSRRLGMNYQVAFRSPGAEVILPAVVHWNVEHYAALIARDGDLLRAEDPTFNTTKVWLSEDALDDEASGYFLVRPGPLPKGWREVSDLEASQVWGKGTTDKSDPDATGCYDEKAKVCRPVHDEATQSSRPCGPGSPMAEWNVHLLLASHHVEDTPVGYTPPVGPPIYIRASYNSVNGWPDFGLPYSNISQEWRLNWVDYLTDDPRNPTGDVRFIAGEGGAMTFTDFNPTNQVFKNLFRNRANMVRTGTNSYELRYPDGSRRIFDQPVTNSVGTTRRIFMSAIVDPAGNAATVQFDSPGRIASITDAIGQKTQFFYDRPLTNEFIHPSVAWVPPFLLTRVVDPFGRTARFDYGSSINARLASITDAIGITSSFLYDYNPGQTDLGMTNLITPYGTTTFKRGSHRGVNRANWVEITHPNGEKERVEYSEEVNLPWSEPLGIVPKGVPVRNYILWARNTCHWDRKAYAEGYARLDYTKARIYHWLHGQDYTTASGILESYKEPLEHRVWYNYDGQVNATFVGTSDQPTSISRTTEDGTTQLYQFEYNSLSKPTKAIDPLGRELTFIYESNDIDVKEVRQTRAGQNELLFRATYNPRHLPLTVTDAAGQMTRFGYNARGQVVGITNALGHVTTLEYNSNGYLLAIDGPLPGVNDTSRLGYDNVGRLRTATGADNYTLTFDYDVLDRLTRVTYPDSTYEAITYNLLDPQVLRDRTGRETRLTYDSVRQLIAVEDALGRITRYDWCGCGGLDSIIDPLGRVTSWIRDVQGRVTAKVNSDGSQVRYQYDTATGWLKSIRDEQNQITMFDYNLDSTLQQKRYFNTLVPTPPVKFTYDPNYYRLLTREDGTNLTSFSYHPVTGGPSPGAGQRALIDGPLPNDEISFTYDELGRETMRSINDVAVRRTWDEAGRLARLTNILGTFGFTWAGASSRLQEMILPNGQRSTFTYFSGVKDRLIQQITHLKPDATLLSRFTYDFNAAGQMTEWTQERTSLSPVTYQFRYDAIDRLTNIVASGGLMSSYGYDAAHNLTNETVNGVARAFSHNVLNELIASTNTPGSTRLYEWDAEHRLAAINHGTRRTEFTYDGLDRRTRIVEKDNGAVVSDRRYVWCGSKLCEERDASGAQVLKRFDPFGVQISAQGGPQPGNYFYTMDHLSSVREMTDSAGQPRAIYDYTPFGKRSRAIGDMESDFGFTGMYFHGGSDLNLALYRAYDANLARWLSRDPAGIARVNLYAYARGDPINLVDRFGLDESRPDLLEFSTGNETLDSFLGTVKGLWDKTSLAEKTTKPAEEFYDKAETAIEIYNDVDKVSDLAGDCSIAERHDPDRMSWNDLKNSGREGLEIFKTFNKWIKRLTGNIPGSEAVTGPATELGEQIAETGAGYIEESHGLLGGNTESGRQVQRILGGRDD